MFRELQFRCGTAEPQFRSASECRVGAEPGHEQGPAIIGSSFGAALCDGDRLVSMFASLLRARRLGEQSSEPLGYGAPAVAGRNQGLCQEFFVVWQA